MGEPGTSSALCIRINNYSRSSQDAWVFDVDPVPGSDFCQPGDTGCWMPTQSAPLASFSFVDLFWVCQFKVFARRVLWAHYLEGFSVCLGLCGGH